MMPFLKDPNANISAETLTIEWIRKIPFPDYVKNAAENLTREVATAARNDESYWNVKARITEGLCSFGYNVMISERFIKDFECRLMLIMEDITKSKIDKTHE